jgi:hypothetical protein
MPVSVVVLTAHLPRSWGVRLGLLVTPNVEIGALFNQQSTDLEASGAVDLSLPQDLQNYHGYLSYFGDPDAATRPYVLPASARRGSAASTPRSGRSPARRSSRAPGRRG